MDKLTQQWEQFYLRAKQGFHIKQKHKLINSLPMIFMEILSGP